MLTLTYRMASSGPWGAKAVRRRDFFAWIGGAAVAPTLAALSSNAQPTPNPVIGYLSSKGETAEAGTVAAIRKGLAERNFIDDENVKFSYRWSKGDYSRLPQLAAELVGEKVNVIAASGRPAALAARQVTSVIPIVFRLAIDPVAFHLVQSFDRPGGNITGVTMLFDPLTPKKLQLLHELVPSAGTIGLLVIQKIKTPRRTRTMPSVRQRPWDYRSRSCKSLARRK